MSGTYLAKGERNLARLVQAIQDLFAGRNNAFGEFTLAVAPATTTTVTAPNSATDSIPLFTPLTAHAAAELGAGTMYVSQRNQGSFVITHSSSAQVDRTFGYHTSG